MLWGFRDSREGIGLFPKGKSRTLLCNPINAKVEYWVTVILAFRQKESA
jgi:hypothetical protein